MRLSIFVGFLWGGIFMGLTMGLLSAAMPRSGGDYVWVSHILSPPLGFTMSWAWLWVQLFAVAMYFAWLVNWGLSTGLATFAIATNNAGLLAMSGAVATTEWTFIIGSAALWLCCGILCLNPRYLKGLMIGTLGVSILGTIVIAVLFGTTSHNAFISSFNSVLATYTGSSDTYHEVINSAKDLGLAFPEMSLSASFMALPLGWWSTFAYTWSMYIGGEVKTPSRSQPLVIMGSLVTIVILELAILFPYYNALGYDFINAVAYLGYQHPDKYILPAQGTVNFFASLLTPNVVLNALISLAFVLGIFGLGIGMFMANVRTMFAWAFNRMLPEALTKIGDRSHAPWAMTVFATVLSQILFILFLMAPQSIFINYVLFYSIIYAVTSIAAIVFPFWRKDLFDASPGIVRKKIGGLPVITICGLVNGAFFVLLFATGLMSPMFSGPIGPSAYAWLVGTLLLGAVAYYAIRAYRNRQGINIDLLWKEIPPE
jgi:amino acid transporter